MKNERIDTYCRKVAQMLALRKAFMEGFMKGEDSYIMRGFKIMDAMVLAESKYPMPELESEGELAEIAEARRITPQEKYEGEVTSTVEAGQTF